MLRLTGVVHSCSNGTIPVVAMVEGQPVEAYANGLTIEVVGESRSWTFDVAGAVGADMGAARLAFAVGTTVTVTLEVAP